MPAHSVCGLTNLWMFSILLSGFIKYNLSPHQFPWEGGGRERLTSPVFWQQKSTIRMHRELIFKNNTFQRKSPQAAQAVCCVSWSATVELCQQGWASVVFPAALLGEAATVWLPRAVPSLSNGSSPPSPSETGFTKPLKVFSHSSLLMLYFFVVLTGQRTDCSLAR